MQGELVQVWNNGGRDIQTVITQNTSRHARNLRLRLVDCPHAPGTSYMVNLRHDKFLDTHGEQVWGWNNNGLTSDKVIRGSTSCHAGNLRWILYCL